MAFPKFPYTDFHRLNADWILETVKAASAAVAESLEAVRTALSDAVLYISQTKTAQEQRTACGNIGAVSYHTQSASPADRTVARANLQAVGYEAQTLTEAEKTQARTNIGAADSNAIPDVSDVVRTTSQTFTADEQRTACGNIKAVSYHTQSASPADRTVARANLQAVGYEAQTLTEAEKTQARTNIGALGSSDVPVPEGAVLYNEAQTLTTAQKARARENIGAISESVLPDDYVFFVEENEQGTGYDVTGNLTDAAQATGRVFIILERVGQTREALADLSYTGETLNTVSASFADFFAVDSVIPNTIFNVAITSSGATVTEIQQRQVPQPAPLGTDAGKCLVAGRTACSWERITPIVNTVSGTTPTVTPADNNIYNCGELTSLTISNPPATGAYSIVFTSGATATIASGFSTILGLESFTPEANTIYEINVLNNRAVIGNWEAVA